MLGTGTSCGFPFIGCHCPVCLSSNPKDKRWRSSILIEKGETKVVIDTGYEFRLQCLRAGIERLDGVLYTHTHPDHLAGLDDLRAFYREGKSIDVGGRERCGDVDGSGDSSVNCVNISGCHLTHAPCLDSVDT